jgi:hypothetical protein
MFIPIEQEENVTNEQAGTQRSVAGSPWIGQEPEKTWLQAVIFLQKPVDDQPQGPQRT